MFVTTELVMTSLLNHVRIPLFARGDSSSQKETGIRQLGYIIGDNQ